MVSYSKKGCGIGRRYAEKSLSLQNFNTIEKMIELIKELKKEWKTPNNQKQWQ